MLHYKSYIHIEKLGNQEVEGIEFGTCFIFPKLDGSNASVFLHPDGELRAGSRTRQLSLDRDNAGFYAWALEQPKLMSYLQAHPNHRLFGEWLVPHTLKTYRADAWRRFWIFDVCVGIEGSEHELFLNYDVYSEELEKFGLDYVQPMKRVENATHDYLWDCLDHNKFLIEDNNGVGEGIVIKNYEFVNKYNRVCWAKIVRQDFKEANQKVFGTNTIKLHEPVEKSIVDRHLTTAMIDKIYANIAAEQGGWQSKFIPRLLETAFYDLVREEAWTFIKEFNLPTVNFKTLKNYTIQKVKTVKKELF